MHLARFSTIAGGLRLIDGHDHFAQLLKLEPRLREIITESNGTFTRKTDLRSDYIIFGSLAAKMRKVASYATVNGLEYQRFGNYHPEIILFENAGQHLVFEECNGVDNGTVWVAKRVFEEQARKKSRREPLFEQVSRRRTRSSSNVGVEDGEGATRRSKRRKA